MKQPPIGRLLRSFLSRNDDCPRGFCNDGQSSARDGGIVGAPSGKCGGLAIADSSVPAVASARRQAAFH